MEESNKTQSMSRRDFFGASLKMVTGVALGGSAILLAACSKEEKAPAKAAETAAKKMEAMPKEEKLAFELVSEEDPVAKAIGYKHDVMKADKSKYPMWKAENTCTKCMHYVEVKNADGTVNMAQGRCKLIPTTIAEGGPTVKAEGWCSVWAAKPA